MLAEQRTYRIGTVARFLGVTVHYLRIAERLGTIPRARRADNGWRYYTPEDIDRLRSLGVGERKRQIEAADG